MSSWLARAALGAAALGLAGCQVVLGIDTDVPLLDGGAGGSGGSGPTKPKSCADGAPIVCDDFEEAAIDTGRWQFDAQRSGSIAIDTKQPHGGKRALHAHTDAIATSGGAQAIAALSHVGLLPQHFFVRFYARVAAPLPTTPEPLILINIQKQDDGGMQLYVQSGDMGFTSWANDPGLNLSSATAFSTNAWHCVEWEVTKASSGSSDGKVVVSLDGDRVGALVRSDITTPEYDEIVLGLSFTQPDPGPAHDVWIDDLRVDTAAIGCLE